MREDQPRVYGRTVLGADAEPLAGAGAKAVEKDVGLGRQLEQPPGLGLDVEVDDALAAMQ
jgi:hypothetical protein